MQKKIIALAIASALTAPALAFADSANVNFYGVLFADVERVSVGTAATGTTPTVSNPTSRGRVISDASRFGLSGSDDLGNGLTGIFQIESRVNLTGTETAAGTSATGGATSTNLGIFDGIRNTNLGLKGGFGTVFVGQWDTPFKVSHNKVELFDNTTIATAYALLGSFSGSVNVVSGAYTSGANAFNLRQGSSIQYWTPDMGGFVVKGAYSTLGSNAAGATAGTTATAAGTPNVMSLSATYDQGPIYVAAAYESHKNPALFPATGTAAGSIESTDKGERLVGAYTMDAFQVGLTWEKLTLAANNSGVVNGRPSDQSRNAYSLEGKYNIPSAGTIAATYTKTGDMTGTTDSGATQVSVRYGYMMSKRTELFAMATNIKNGANANYNFADVPAQPSANGSSVKGYGVGVRHTF